MSALRGWHFLGPDRALRYPPHTPVVVGKTLRFDGPPILCQQGLHASVRVASALKYAPAISGLVLCRVTLGGAILADIDKHVATERTCHAMTEADPILHGWACWCAEGALLGASVRAAIDPRSLEAIRVKRAWLRSEASDAELDAARDAARDAAWAVARAVARAAAGDAAGAAARAAAWAAAGAAARAAAGDATRAAAWDAARAAARAAAGDAMADELERRCLAALGETP